MPTEDAPSLEDYDRGQSVVAVPLNLDAAQTRVRIAIAALAAMVLILGFTVLRQRGVLPVAAATGRVVGQVMDASDTPIRAYIFVINTQLKARADGEGRFRLDGVPAGARSLVVADEAVGREIRIVVPAAGEVDVGQVRLVTTPVP